MATDHNFKVKNGLIVDGGEIYLQGVATPQIFFNGNADAGIDMAIKATPESLDFYEPEDSNKLHMRIIDDGGVNAVFGFRTGAGDGTVRLDGSGNLLNIGTISSGVITGTTATAAGGTNTTALASTAFVQQELTTLIGGAPSTLNDLNELAAAINDDANYNSTLTTALATKLPLAGGALTGTLTTANSLKVTGLASSNSSPAANQVELSGYGLIGNRGNLYITNADASGQIVMGISGAHNANPKLTVTTSGITVAGNIGMTTGHSSGKFAVMATSVHGSYDFYNNGTSYFNGTTEVNAEFKISSGSSYTTHFNYQDNGINIISQANGGSTAIRNNNGDLLSLSSGGNLSISGTISSGAITSTVVDTGDATFLTLHHDTGADLDTQQSFIDFSFEDDNTNETPQVRIGAQVGQNNNADSQEKEGSGAFVIHTNNAESSSGAAGASLAERMRVDYQGNVLIGKTASDFATAGAELAKDGTPGKVQFSRASNPLSLNNITNNGNIISFYKGAGAVGDIGIEGGDSLYIQSGTTSGSGLRFHPSAGTVEPVRNGITIHNTINLGSATRQFKDAYFEKVYVRQNTTQTGAVLEFSDEPASWSQNGSITFRHVDTASYGSGAMFEIGSDQPTTTILAQGKLYFSEGLYTKPASGTGVGTLRISSSGNATLGTISSGAITSTGIITSADFFKATGQNIKFSAGGTHVLNMDVNRKIYPQTHNSTDLGHSDTLAFRNLRLVGAMTGGATISSGAITSNGALSVSGAITSSSVMDLTVSAVSGAVMGANRSLGINATEAQIHLVADNGGDWASNIVLTNYSSGQGTRHYWIHNAPATASANAGKFELRTSTTTTAAQIGGQGSGSTALVVVDSNGDLTSTGINSSSRYIQTGNSGSSFYAASFTRSASGTTTPDIWGANGTLVLGTSSSVEAIGLSGANATFYGSIDSGNATMYKAGTNNVQTQVLCLGSDSTRPLLQFSESTGTGITSGMSLEYNGQGSGDTNFMTFNSVSGSPIFKVYSGGNAVVTGELQTNSNISINNSDGFVYLNNDGVGNAGIYVRGIGSSDTLRSHSTDNFRWEVLGSQKMELNSSGDLDVLSSYKLNGGKFASTKEYTGTSSFASSGDWHTLCTITESNTPAYFSLKMAAHSTLTFVVTMGYHGSNVANINVLSSTWTANGGYPHPSSLRILKDSSSNYKLQMQMTWSSSTIAGFYMYARVWGASGPQSVPTFASSLGADTTTGTTITSGYVGRTGATNLGGQWVKPGSNSAPSYSFHDDDNTGMYRDTTDSIGFATDGTQRVTISNSGLDVKSGTLRMNGQEVISATRNLSAATITGTSLNVTGLTKFGDTAGSPAADIHVYGTGNNYLRLRGTAANDFEIDLQGTSATGQLVFNQFDLKTNNNIIIDGNSKYLIIENHEETDSGIIFNDGDASTGGNWHGSGSSGQAFKIQYHCGNETLIMGHDNDSYAGFNFAIGGNFTASGNVTAYSDERLKENIETLDGSKVLQMRGVSFTKEGKQGSGVIAQELEKVAPELVIEGEYKSVAYGNLVGYLIENAKQQQERIEKLEELVHRLTSEK